MNSWPNKKLYSQISSICFLLIFPFFSCTQHVQGENKGEDSKQEAVKEVVAVDISPYPLIDTTFYKIRCTPSGAYQSVKSKGVSLRNAFAEEYDQVTGDSLKNKILDQAGKTLTEYILNDIMPFWYGTPWTFEGHTDIPGEGTVACGYLVSTTLKHAGFNLNRYKLAQKAGKPAARSLSISGQIKTLSNCTRKAVKEYFLKNKADGLYFVGLDCHVGYLLKRNGELFFIHSNYIRKEGVIIEPVEKSQAFASKVYCIGDITTDRQLMEYWINNKAIQIVD